MVLMDFGLRKIGLRDVLALEGLQTAQRGRDSGDSVSRGDLGIQLFAVE